MLQPAAQVFSAAIYLHKLSSPAGGRPFFVRSGQFDLFGNKIQAVKGVARIFRGEMVFLGEDSQTVMIDQARFKVDDVPDVSIVVVYISRILH